MIGLVSKRNIRSTTALELTFHLLTVNISANSNAASIKNWKPFCFFIACCPNKTEAAETIASLFSVTGWNLWIDLLALISCVLLPEKARNLTWTLEPSYLISKNVLNPKICVSPLNPVMSNRLQILCFGIL